MIYKDIILNGFGRKINLCFYSKITLLGGDSGIGKTLVYQMLSRLNAQDKFKNIYCINSEAIRQYNINLIESLKNKKNCLIVIDNAEEILGKNEREYILRNHDNQYLIMGRNREGLGLSENSIGELVVNSKQIYIAYKRREEIIKARQKPYKFDFKLP